MAHHNGQDRRSSDLQDSFRKFHGPARNPFATLSIGADRKEGNHTSA